MEGEETAKTARCLVLSPQSEIPAFRTFLQTNGYRISGEALICEEKKYYFLMTAVPGNQEPWMGADRLYGKFLLEQGGETVITYVKKRKAVLERILKSLKQAKEAKADTREQETAEELRLTEEALSLLSGR